MTHDQIRLRPAGTGALVSGAVAITLLGLAFLLPWAGVMMGVVAAPAALVPALWSVVESLFARRRVRRGEEAASVRLRAGFALGSLALAAVLALIGWAVWSLEHAAR
ncbi:hypothetical protein [Streptomyces sp. NPDC090022]|uniref:hypothetical protein n=1 Tax=Streptomyces sp. NPDC090022 TaxID=3365920 RepID=UPI0038038A1F